MHLARQGEIGYASPSYCTAVQCRNVALCMAHSDDTREHYGVKRTLVRLFPCVI